jgi:hypothetical protein
MFDSSDHGGDRAGWTLKLIERCVRRNGEEEFVVFTIGECMPP